MHTDYRTLRRKYWKEEKVKVKLLSHVWLFVTPWTVAYEASLSLGFSRQEYSSGLPFPSPGDLPNTGIELGPPTLQAVALTSEPLREGKGSPIEHFNRLQASQVVLVPCQYRGLKRLWFSPWVVKIPWGRAWQPTPVFLPGESRGQGTWWATIQRVTKSQTQLKRAYT